MVGKESQSPGHDERVPWTHVGDIFLKAFFEIHQ